MTGSLIPFPWSLLLGCNSQLNETLPNWFQGLDRFIHSLSCAPLKRFQGLLT